MGLSPFLGLLQDRPVRPKHLAINSYELFLLINALEVLWNARRTN